MTHWTRYCATASFVYHSGKPILTLNLSPSRQSELLVGSTVKSLYKHTGNTDSSLNEHFASVPNILFFTSLDWQNTLTCKSLEKILWCYHSNETSPAVFSHGTIYLVCSSNFLSVWIKSYGVTIPMKPLQQYFHMVLFIQYVVLTCKSLEKILWCYYSNETSLPQLLHSIIYMLRLYQKKFVSSYIEGVKVRNISQTSYQYN